MGKGGAKWEGKGKERRFLKEKAFIIGAAGAAKTVLCVCVCVCLGMWILSELVFFSCMCPSVCLLLSCVPAHREPGFDQSVIGVKTENGDPFSCPATSAAP